MFSIKNNNTKTSKNHDFAPWKLTLRVPAIAWNPFWIAMWDSFQVSEPTPTREVVTRRLHDQKPWPVCICVCEAFSLRVRVRILVVVVP